MRVESPGIKHGQKINRNQAGRYFQQVKTWLGQANHYLSVIKNSGLDRTMALERIEKIKQGFSSIQRDVQWLKERGFSDPAIEKELRLIEDRMNGF